MLGWFRPVKSYLALKYNQGRLEDSPLLETWVEQDVLYALQKDENEGWISLTEGYPADQASSGLGMPIPPLIRVKPENWTFEDNASWLYPFVLAHERGAQSNRARHYEAVQWEPPIVKTEDRRYEIPVQSAVFYTFGMELNEYKVLRLIHAIASNALVVNVVGSFNQTQAIGGARKQYFGFVVRPWVDPPTRLLIRLRGPGLLLRHAVAHLVRMHARIGDYWIALHTFDLSNFLWYSDHLEMASYEHAVLYEGTEILSRSISRLPDDVYRDSQGLTKNKFYNKVCTEDRARLARCLVGVRVDELDDMYEEIKSAL